jgi:hypothetical protein
MASSDEAMLSDKERAALAQLEERAAAEDPRFASQLRGGQVRRRRPGGLPDAAWATTIAGHLWASLRPAVWGPVLLVGGLALVVIGLAVSLVVGVVGVVLATAGIALLVDVVRDRVRAASVRRSLGVPDSPGE